MGERERRRESVGRRRGWGDSGSEGEEDGEREERVRERGRGG